MASKQPLSKQRYDKAYGARPEQKANRAARGRARYAYEKEHGDLPSNIDVNHKKRIAKGGTNAKGNLEPKSQHANRGWRRGKKQYG